MVGFVSTYRRDPFDEVDRWRREPVAATFIPVSNVTFVYANDGKED